MATAERNGRRDKGSGSFRWRGRNSVELRVWDPELRKHITQTVRDVADDRGAREHLALFMADVLRGKVPRGSAKITVAEVAYEWLRHKERMGAVSDATLAQAESLIRLHIKPELGKRPVRKVAALELEQHYGNLRFPSEHRSRGLGAKTIAHVSGLMFQILEYAHRRDYVAGNVAALVEGRPKFDDRTVAVPEDEEVQAYLKVAQETNFDLFAYVLLTAATGARRGEILGLQRRDVLLETGEVMLRQAVTWRRRKVDSEGKPIDAPTIIIKEPKSAAGRRTSCDRCGDDEGP